MRKSNANANANESGGEPIIPWEHGEYFARYFALLSLAAESRASQVFNGSRLSHIRWEQGVKNFLTWEQQRNDDGRLHLSNRVCLFDARDVIVAGLSYMLEQIEQIEITDPIGNLVFSAPGYALPVLQALNGFDNADAVPFPPFRDSSAFAVTYFLQVALKKMPVKGQEYKVVTYNRYEPSPPGSAQSEDTSNTHCLSKPFTVDEYGEFRLEEKNVGFVSHILVRESIERISESRVVLTLHGQRFILPETFMRAYSDRVTLISLRCSMVEGIDLDRVSDVSLSRFPKNTTFYFVQRNKLVQHNGRTSLAFNTI